MFLPNMAGYSSLKRALIGISLTAREELKKDHIVVSVVYPYITETDFEKNTLKDLKGVKSKEPEENDNGFQLPPPDSAGYVAQKIIEAIIGEKAEIFAHDWMNRRNK
jgi:short-subunit dehydrogenase